MHGSFRMEFRYRIFGPCIEGCLVRHPSFLSCIYKKCFSYVTPFSKNIKKRTCCNVEQPLSRAISGNIKDILLYIMIGSLTGGYDSGLACILLTTPFLLPVTLLRTWFLVSCLVLITFPCLDTCSKNRLLLLVLTCITHNSKLFCLLKI